MRVSKAKVLANKNFIKIMSRFFMGVVMAAVMSGCDRLEAVDMEDKPLDKPLPINTRPKVLAIGSGFSVGIKKDGTVWTWGSNHKGILARPVKTPEEGCEPGQAPGLTDAVSVSASESVLVLTKDGSVWSWGNNDNMRLGYASKDEHRPGTIYPPATPQKIIGLPKIVAVEMAGQMGLALAEDGVIWAWGGGGRYTLFDIDGGVKDFRPPTPIKGLPRIKMMSSGGSVIAAIDESGQLWTVGISHESARRISEKELPVNLIDRVSLPGKVVDVNLRAALAGIALLEDGRAFSWGWNGSGQLGQGHKKTLFSPARIKTLSRIRLLSAGLDYMAAVSADGDVLYWGNLIYGPSPEPMISTKLSIDSPIRIKAGVRATELVTGSAAVAYLDEQGQAWYFGWNRRGERGTGVMRGDVLKEYVLTPEKSHWSR